MKQFNSTQIVKKNSAQKSAAKNFMPISIDISSKKILIIGGDESAFKKLMILQRFNAEVEVIGRRICDGIKISGVKYFEKPYHKQFLAGYFMLYSCTNNPFLDRQILMDGMEMGVLVNIHDNPGLCQFVSPAIYKNKNITVAVGSNAENVYESINLRDAIKTFVEDKFNNNNK